MLNTKRPFVYVLQHVDVEGLGLIATSLERRGIEARFVRGYEDQKVPRIMGDALGLIVMGGPMGAYEGVKYPYLMEENLLIEDALKQLKPILGVCLGSQLLAQVLGSKVRPGSIKEIGWYDLRLTQEAKHDQVFRGLPDVFKGLLWHGDIFDCPEEATLLSFSENALCQAFAYKDYAYGILFHLETTSEMLQNMFNAFQSELVEAGVDAKDLLKGIDKHMNRMHDFGSQVYEEWVGLLTGERA